MNHMLVPCLMILSSTKAAIEQLFRSPYGIKLCRSWCQQHYIKCIDATFTVENLTCIMQHEKKVKKESGTELLERGVATRAKVTKHMELVDVGRKIKGYFNMNKTCNKHSGRLPKIDSRKKQAVLLKLIRSTRQNVFPIGVYELNGAWTYIDGTPVTYMHTSMGKGELSKGGFVGVMAFGWFGITDTNAMGPKLICEIFK